MLQDKLNSEPNTETHDITIIRRQRRQFSVYCRECCKDVSTFTTQQMKSWFQAINNGTFPMAEVGQDSPVCPKAGK